MTFEHDKPLSIELVILEHEMAIGNLSTRMYHSARAEWQINVNNYLCAVNDLESKASPYLTDKAYKDDVKKLEENYEKMIEAYRKEKAEKKEAYAKKGQNYEMSVTIAFIATKYRLIQNQLEKQGILRKRLASADEKGDPDQPGIAGQEVPDDLMAAIQQDIAAGNQGEGHEQIPMDGQEPEQ